MSALVLEAPGEIRLRSLPIPEPGPGDLVIRVEAATTCGTDLKAYLRGHPQIPMPGPFGHEYAGVVAAAGKDAPFSEGDAVMGVHSAPCQSCAWCRRGQENLCESIMATKVLGSYAPYLLIPERIARLNVFPKPAAIAFERASLLEPLACVAQGLMNVGLDSLRGHPKSKVLVLGPGAVGLMFVAALRSLGIDDLTLAGRNRKRLAVGERLGARTVSFDDLDALANPGFDLVVECTGSVEVWERSLSFARRGGKVVLFGGCPSGSNASFDTSKLHYGQVDLISPFHFGTEAVRTARDWLLDRKLVLEPLLSGERSLEEGPQVFEDLRQGNGIKYVFRP